MTTSVPAAQAARERVPFLDLAPSHAPVRDEILREIGEVIDSGRFVNGPQVAEFEEAFARYCGSASCVGMASGLDALRLALLAMGIEPGDEVLVPANTFVATLEAVTQAGGVPVLVDATETDYNIDVGAADAAVGPRTRFAVPVHLYGQLADVRALAALAGRRGIELLEDACQAHGAERDGMRAGTLGRAAAFSFYPGKNLGAMGDAGAAVCDDPSLAERMRALREHGQRAKYVHDFEGYTARLDTIQAVVLLRKLRLVEAWNAQRREIAAYYAEHLREVGDLRLPPVPEGSEPVWHLYVVRTGDPEALAAHLTRHGVSTGRHYPFPVHLTPAYARLGLRAGAFPVAERLAAEALSLPIFPGMREEQCARVVAAVESFFSRG